MPATRWAVLLAAVAPLACSKQPPAQPAAGGGEPGPIAVKVASPRHQPLEGVIEQPGTIRPFEVTPVVAKLPGYLKAIAPDPAARAKGRPDAVIDIGSVVAKDQPLATLDIPELVAEAAEKRAGVEFAKAGLEQARKELAVADAQVAAAEAAKAEAEAGVAKAGADYERWKTELAQADELVSRKVIDAQSRAVTFKQFQGAEAAKAEAEARVRSAAAAVAERSARRERVNADIAAAAAKVKVAEAEAERVKALVGYTEVKAPFDGIVTARNVHPGHFLQPAAGTQNPVLFIIARIDVVRVDVDVPEASAARAGPGTKAAIRVPSLGNRAFEGSVTRTAGVVQPDTRMLRVEIELENKDRAVMPGVYASVVLRPAATDATVLPAGCILPADETHYAFLVENGKAVKYRVRVGRTEGTNVQVLGRRKAPLTAGDWEPFTGSEKVVVGNLGALNDGAAVEVKE